MLIFLILFLCLISFVLMRESLYRTEGSDENNFWFGCDIQKLNTHGFHLGFHCVSKVIHEFILF